MTDENVWNNGQVVFLAGYGSNRHDLHRASWWMGNIRVDNDQGEKYTPWAKLLETAKAKYGDPNMHWASGKDLGLYDKNLPEGDRAHDRYLVYGDGTRVPADGKITQTAPDGKRYTAESDGTYRQVGNPNGILASSFTKGPDGRVTAYGRNSNGDMIPLYTYPAGSDKAKALENDTKNWVYDPETRSYVPTSENSSANPPAATPDKETDGSTEGGDESGGKGGDGDQGGAGGKDDPTHVEGEELLDPTPWYPRWASDPAQGGDPGVSKVLKTTLVNLRKTLGTGAPEGAKASPTNYASTITGAPEQIGSDKSVSKYADLNGKFKTLATIYDDASKRLISAVQASADYNSRARAAISSAITDFNTANHALTSPDFGKLLDNEIACLTSVRNTVAKALGQSYDIPEGDPQAVSPAGGNVNAGGNGGGNSDDTGSGTTPSPDGVSPDGTSPNPSGDPTAPSTTDDTNGSGLDPALQATLNKILANPAGTTNPQQNQQGQGQGQNPLSSNPLSGLSGLGANPLGSGSTPDLSSILKSLGDTGKGSDDSGKGKDKDGKDTPAAPSPGGSQDAPITPVTPATPTPTPGAGEQNDSTPAPTPAATPTPVPAAVPAADHAGGQQHQVKLPDGKTVNAPGQLQADVANKAVADTSGTQDQAAALYEAANSPLPTDGNLGGAKVDPGDAQPGSYFKWDDGTTRIVVAPGLLSDGHGGVVSFEDMLAKKPDGFVGAFDPSAKDTTLQTDTPTAPQPTAPATPTAQADAGHPGDSGKPASPATSTSPTPAPAGGGADTSSTPPPHTPPPSPPPGGGTGGQDSSTLTTGTGQPPTTPAAPPTSEPPTSDRPISDTGSPAAAGVSPPPSPFAPTPGLPAPKVSTAAERAARGEE